jgi:serine/threonine-protein kinase
VAVKMLHEPFAAKREPVQRLYREAQATGAIGHANIIKVHDVGETEEGVPFLVMELLAGESLGEHIERHGPRPLGFVLDVAIQMLSALHAAHQSGIIHRDLKSDNIFLLRSEDESLRIKILDFGISKFSSPDQDGLKLTQTGTLLGTPYYMSPEQASGRSDLDTRIDIYAAGVIVYEALLGVVPHRATNYNALLIEIIRHRLHGGAGRDPP